MQKLLIGYDGSPEAQAAIDDLTTACIPEPVEALVLSVADVWLPANDAASGSDVPQPAERVVTDPHSNVYAAAQAALENSRATAVQGAKQLALKFPDWRVTSDCMADSPGWALVAKARTWKAHLVVVGAHSRTIFERFFFGSTASKVAMEAPSSVRIARPRQRSHERKPRIILAVDGSRDSEQAMRAVASRKWPLATEIRVMTVLNSKLETAMASPGSFARHWAQNHVEGTKEWISAMAVNFARHLNEGGQSAEAHIFEGDPKKVLLREAEAWEADCIFLGARGLNHGERWLLGSVASAVASRAHCSVEIVRPT